MPCLDDAVRAHAFQFVRQVLKEWQSEDDSNLSRSVLTIRFGSDEKPAIATLADFLYPQPDKVDDQPALSHASHFDFQQESGSIQKELHKRDVMPKLDVRHSKLYVFVEQHLTPAYATIVKGAPHIVDRESIAAAEMTLLELDEDSKRCTVAVEPNGFAPDKLDVITANTFSLNEWMNMWCWDCGANNYYDFGVRVPEHLRNPLQQVVAKLVSVPRGEGTVVIDHDPNGHTMASLKLLHDHGLFIPQLMTMMVPKHGS